MHPTTRALLEALDRVLDVPPEQGDIGAHYASDAALVAWRNAGRPDLQPRVGGDPPVPGVGWGVETVDSPWARRVDAVLVTRTGWIVSFRVGAHEWDADHTAVRALYRPGDPADQPCWRRA